MTTHLTPYEEKILGALDIAIWGGTTTGGVARKCGHFPAGVESRASQSALVMRSLKRLEKRGLVKRLDDQLPIAWVLAKERGAE